MLFNHQKIDQIVEYTLKMTLNPTKTNLYYLVKSESKFFTIDLIEIGLFERIMSMAFESSEEHKIINYLYDSYQRVQKEIKRQNNDVLEVLSNIEDLIFRNISTLLKQPEILSSCQNISQQFLSIFQDNDIEDAKVREKFLSKSIEVALKESDETMRTNVMDIFYKNFDECLKIVRQSNMITLEKWIMTYLLAFVTDKNNSQMANMFLYYNEVSEESDGIKYSETLLGKLLCI